MKKRTTVVVSKAIKTTADIIKWLVKEAKPDELQVTKDGTIIAKWKKELS